ncbi:hypothetical protein TYRP_015069 [Tyrophagus putrescentiae]|nr:hypothetical protein TYRP_015069 [Tyrophagus putrescentiae]
MFVSEFANAGNLESRAANDFGPVTTKISSKVWRRPGPALWETHVFLWESSKRLSVNGSLRNLPPQSVSHRAAAANAPNFNGHQRYSNSLREAAATRTDLEDNQRYSKSLQKTACSHNFENHHTIAAVLPWQQGPATKMIIHPPIAAEISEN